MSHWKKVSKLLAGLLSVSLLFSCIGCGKKTKSGTGKEVKLAAEGIYPVECGDTLTVWMALNSELSTVVTEFGETELAKELEKETGVKVKYSHPAQGQESEQFNLMVASNELTDIVQWNWYTFGAQQAINTGYIVSLNEIMQKWSPNLTALLAERSDLDTMIKTDEGNYYVYPFFRGSKIDRVYSGPVIRKDWLDQLNLQVPETIDEWENMLRAFKTKLNVPIPFSCISYFMTSGVFSGAYGVTTDFYIDDAGKVQYGPMQTGYYDYLKKMNQWYQEGLLDKNIANVDDKAVDANVLNETLGATAGTAGGGIGKWMLAKKDQNPSFELVGAPYPVLNKGDKPQFGVMDWDYLPSSSFAITTKCKNQELAARFLDYGYGEKGKMLYNFGIEGVSYNMENGEPVLTELITNNPDKLSFSTALMTYAMGTYSGPFIQDTRIVEAMQSDPKNQREAVYTWSATDMEKHKMPLVSLTADENKEISNIMSEAGTYATEMIMKFMVGVESLDKWDEYLTQLQNFHVDKAISIYQTALERYHAR